VSGLKFFDPGWGWAGSAVFGLGMDMEISPKNVKFFNFLLFGLKKMSSGRVKKYPGQSRAGLLLLRVKSKLGSGPISILED